MHLYFWLLYPKEELPFYFDETFIKEGEINFSSKALQNIAWESPDEFKFKQKTGLFMVPVYVNYIGKIDSSNSRLALQVVPTKWTMMIHFLLFVFIFWVLYPLFANNFSFLAVVIPFSLVWGLIQIGNFIVLFQINRIIWIFRQEGISLYSGE